jgi:hypothetical protein
MYGTGQHDSGIVHRPRRYLESLRSHRVAATGL